MSRPQPCDSYFIESQDSAAERRQYEGIIKRQRQDRIADELSMKIRSQYMDGIVEHMAFMEVRLTHPGIAATHVSRLIFVETNPARCSLHRHSGRDPMVHAPLSVGLFG